jgi:DNA primase
MRYTLSRGLNAYDILRYRIGYCAEGIYKNRIIVPSYDASGRLNYFVARDFYETSEMKYKNPKISKDVVAFDMYVNWEYPIVLCEGVYDAMTIRRNAIPLLGKTIMPKLHEKIESSGIKSIYLALDHDAMRDAIKLATTFVQNGYQIYLLDLQEKDPNVIGFHGMQHLIKHAAPLTFSDIVRLKVKYNQTYS